MSTRPQWSDQAREDVKQAVYKGWHFNHEDDDVVDAVLAALAPHAAPLIEDWEWGVRGPARVSPIGAETARQVVADPLLNDEGNLTVVRRRSAGPWEVAPDA